MLGKHYIVTGGTSGLGLEITKRLIKKGLMLQFLLGTKKSINKSTSNHLKESTNANL